MVGRTISHYRVLAQLGGGGMGVVYEAEDVRLGRPVAIKFLPPELTRNPEALQRFHREARAASALNHPNICTVYDVGDDDGVPYLVMERLEGTTLLERLGSGRLLADELLDVALHLAGALEAAGAKGIVHRDLKPANVFLTKAAGAKILDFGIAKLAEPQALEPDAETATGADPMTVPGTVIGTVPYMSPEQVRAEPVDARTDLFSFGAVLYEMATGRRPFAAKSAALVVDAILHAVPPAPDELISGLPHGLSGVIMRALEKDVRLRYQSASDLRADLLRVRRGTPSAGSAVAQARPAPSSLPVPVTSFVGRRTELERVADALARSRLVTLTGPGGTGKTRLALRVAEEAQGSYAHGVFFVELGALRDPNLLPSAVAQAVGLREVPDVTLSDALSRFLSSRHLLVVLDNFEQLVSAAPGLAEFLLAAPRLSLLVTSRARLNVSAEVEVQVPSLRLPGRAGEANPEDLLTYESVTLFCERAAAARPGFALTKENAPAVAQICARLDGLPLAIELAAARVRHLAPDALLRRLSSRLALLTGGARDLPARQQTLRNAIAWSHDLLSAEEQALFARLSVFSGGFTLEAAEAVSSEIGAPGLDTLDGAASLVDKSLLGLAAEEAEPRYAMLETIREFGLERLAASGEQERAHRAHARYFAGLAAGTGRRLMSGGRERQLSLLAADHDNFRAALAWCASDEGDADLGLRIAADLLYSWIFRSLLGEGSAALSDALARGGSARARAAALVSLALLRWLQGDHEGAAAAAEEALGAFRARADEEGIARTLATLSLVAESRGRHAEARRLVAESAEIFRSLGDEAMRAHVVLNAIEPDDLAAARRDFEEALDVCRARGDTWNVSRALRNLGVVALRSGDFAEARRRLEGCLDLQRELGDRWLIARTLNVLGDVARCTGDLGDAETRYGESRQEEKTLGSRANAAWSLAGLGHVALRKGDVPLAARRLRDALRARPGGAERPELVASCLIGLAEVGRVTGDAAGAAACVVAVSPLLADAGRRVLQVDADLLADIVDSLGAAALARAAAASAHGSLAERIGEICGKETPGLS